MNSLFLTLASGDPLSHVMDHKIHALDALGISWHVVFMLIAGAGCLIVFPLVAKRIASDSPGRLGNFFEAMLLFVRDEMVQPFLGKDTNKYLPLLWSFFFFILFCNLLGMLPVVGKTATGNFSVTVALAVISLVVYQVEGMRRNGFVNYWKANLLVGPWFLWPLMIPIEMLGHCIKPAALAIRLFANMVGGHIMLAVVVGFTAVEGFFPGAIVAVVAAGGAVFLNFLELLVAFIQAIIFTFLTTVFLSMALHPEH